MDTNIEFSTNHSNTPTLSLRYSNIIINLVIPPSPSLFLDGNEVMLACLAGMGLGEVLETALMECYQLIVTTTTVVGSGQKEADGEDYMMISLRGGWSHIEYDLGGGQMTCSLGQKVNEDFTNHVQASNLVPCQK